MFSQRLSNVFTPEGRHAYVSPDVLARIEQSYGCVSPHILCTVVTGMLEWQHALQHGVVPVDGAWPDEPFRSRLVETLCSLGIPTYVRKYPELATTILYQILRMVEQMGSQPRSFGKTTSDPDSTIDQSDRRSEKGQSADDVLESFRQMWKKSAPGIKTAEEVFGDAHGIDSDVSDGFWMRHSWSQLQKLTVLLGRLNEIRDLVANLGRASERGRRNTARQEVPDCKSSRGSYKSPVQPEETGGVCRSGDLSRMTAGECHLLLQGKHGRLLHMAKRVENDLLSYERSGWVEDMTRSKDRLELRPGLKRGPIILCLDTSGSMQGSSEKIAKAVTLQCVIVAHKQRRDCVVFAFSGPGQAKELELSLDKAGIEKMMDFLDHSFHGGTDVDEPLRLSLDRIHQRGWYKADVLMVTDGYVCPPEPSLVAQMSECSKLHGVKMHALLLCQYQEDLDDTRRRMRYFCSNIHVFQSWQRDI